jgi:hypothetical protein
MSSKKKNRKTLKNQITKYVCKKQDICCEENIDRTIAINQIFDLYTEIAEFFFEKDEYLSYLSNDIVGFIGYKIDLKKNKDYEGVKLWNLINQKTYKNTTIDKEEITKLLNEAPLYILLSFLGYAYYKYKSSKDAMTET